MIKLKKTAKMIKEKGEGERWMNGMRCENKYEEV